MRKKLFIYTTSFLSGMSVMAVELSASRLLAPVFSSSQIIWTVIIGLIMICLSIGNLIGGRWADKYNNPDRLYFMMWLASLWIAFIPFIGKFVTVISAPLLALVLQKNLLIYAAALSCLIIFAFPLVILGMTSPFLVKLSVKSMDNNGRTTGEIYALNTIGSIIGTFIPTFATIPLLGTSKTFFLFALVLNLLSLYHFISTRTRSRMVKTGISAALMLSLTVIPFNDTYAFWDDSIVYEGESLYNYLQVKENGDSVILSTNVAFGVQSIYMKDNSLSGFYYDYALTAPMFMDGFTDDHKADVLVLGMGTGTFARQFKRYFPESHIDGVEIDAKIVELSREYFDLAEDEADMFVNDGRTFLMGPDAGMYDVIMVDAYHDITIPFHMTTQEFFTQVKKHLKPGGILVININMRSKQNPEITSYLTGTIRSVMNKVYRFDMDNGTNTLVFASDDTGISRNLSDYAGRIDSSHPLYYLCTEVKDNIIEITGSEQVFTDDCAPVEMLGQKVLDDIISESVRNLKGRMESSQGGIKELLQILSEGW